MNCYRAMNIPDRPVHESGSASSDSTPLDSALALDRTALWPTRRIRAALLSHQADAPCAPPGTPQPGE